MFNNVMSARSLPEDIEGLLVGHSRFVGRIKGYTTNSQQQHHLINPDDVVAEFKHYEKTRNKPAGVATTESQASLILGYLYAYLHTSKKTHLDNAIRLYDAYLKVFYSGQPIPKDGSAIKANYSVNGKEPVVAHYPINDVDPLFSGYKSVPLVFVEGVAKIPQGAPLWGEYLDIASFCHRGHMETEAIDGKVKNIIEQVDWDTVYLHYRITNPTNITDSRAWINWNGYLNNTEGYALDWAGTYQEPHLVDAVIDYDGNMVKTTGEIIGTGLPERDKGTVVLKDRTLNGVYLLNFAVKLPVGNGGRVIGRNEPWNTEVLLVPVITDNKDPYHHYANGLDVEQWMIEVTYLLSKFTNETRYQDLMNSLITNVTSYIDVSNGDKFFLRSTEIGVPFIEGRTIDGIVPKGSRIRYDRNAEGYIAITTYVPFQMFIEQQRVWYRVNRNSILTTTYGGRVNNGSRPIFQLELAIGPNNQDETQDVIYVYDLPPANVTPRVEAISFGRLRRKERLNGTPYLLAYDNTATVSGNAKKISYYNDNIQNTHRGYVAGAALVDTTGKLTISFKLLGRDTFPVNTFLYRSMGPTYLEIVDNNKWIWHWSLRNTNDSWTSIELHQQDMSLANEQPHHLPTDPRPTTPLFDQVPSMDVRLVDGTQRDIRFEYYCVNETPDYFNEVDGYTFRYRISIKGEAAANLTIGDCFVTQQRLDQLKYVPGVLPFVGPNERGIWCPGASRGQPYPSYQVPMIYAIQEGKEEELANMCEFFADAQEAYFDKFGVYGPVMNAYSWSRWDNAQWSPEDTWTMYHWSDKNPWYGTQARSFYNAARVHYELVISNKEVPLRLSVYLNRWVTYLSEFMDKNNSNLPNSFPADSIAKYDPTIPLNGGIIATWSAGLCLCYLSGISLDVTVNTIERVMNILSKTYNVQNSSEDIMNGSWSNDVGTGEGPANTGKFYGIEAGPLMQALALYGSYQQLYPRQSIYDAKDGKFTDIINPDLDHIITEEKQIKEIILDENGDRIILEGY